MREIIKDPLRIRHMIEAVNNVNTFMTDKNLDNLKSDKILFFAVVKNIEILGEAAYKISNEFKEINKHIPWKEIMGMRHVLVHDYYHIDPEHVYKVYKEDFPELLEKLQLVRAML